MNKLKLAKLVNSSRSRVNDNQNCAIVGAATILLKYSSNLMYYFNKFLSKEILLE
jgi:hypothetical protein